jgi:hypothetical protein
LRLPSCWQARSYSASAGLGAIVFLFARHGDSAFGYYGCDISTANIQGEVDPVARLRADSDRKVGLPNIRVSRRSRTKLFFE